MEYQLSKKEFYTNLSTRFGKILYRGYTIENGIRNRVHRRVAYAPSLYLETDETDTGIKSLYGKPLREKKFDSMSAAREYIKTYKDVQSIYGYEPSRWNYNFIASAFPDNLLIGIDEVTVGVVDIETTTDHGKIDVINVPEEITLITYQNLKNKELITWGSRKSVAPNYRQCADESAVLSAFILHIQYDDPDILTGWNTNGFDLPYIINKSNKLLGESITNLLSPFECIEMKEEDVKGKIIQKYTIVGRSCIDLLDMYKKFTYVKRDNYRLQTIATVELGVGKLENPYSTFKEFYESDWDKFVLYNQTDVLRVSELEDKLGLISLGMTIAYTAKINYDDVYGPVKTWECMILGFLMKQNTYVSINRARTSSDGFIGAYVHDPKPGFYDWVVSTDAAQLYPAIIIGLNMSPETIVDTIDTSESKFLNNELDFSGTEYTVAVNGTRFKKDVIGVLPQLLTSVGDGRNIAKRKMLDAKQEKEFIVAELKSRGISV
jgi:DNA polymerase elongation subunit (family B)